MLFCFIECCQTLREEILAEIKFGKGLAEIKFGKGLAEIKFGKGLAEFNSADEEKFGEQPKKYFFQLKNMIHKQLQKKTKKL